jgi:hypothetical protein
MAGLNRVVKDQAGANLAWFSATIARSRAASVTIPK